MAVLHTRLKNEGVIECIENRRLTERACGCESPHVSNHRMDAGSPRKKLAKPRKAENWKTLCMNGTDGLCKGQCAEVSSE